jgi:outer membrane receptor protein involved in Fe transport
MLGKTHAWIGVFILVLIALLAVPNAKAQLTEGTLTGNVTDPSGAAVTGAKVTATNVGTQLRSETLTDSIGFYRLPHLPIGLYNLRIEKTGFKAGLAANVEVEVNVVNRADVTLQIGSPAETVTVTESVPLVQTEEGRLSDIISNRSIEELPLNGRQVYQLATLVPGVTATTAPVVSSVPSPTSAVTFDSGFIANGSTPRGNNFILDGTSNNNEWLGGQPLIYPSLDAIQELQVQTLNFSAEYGRNNGAIVHVVTKQGTNDLHGSAFYSTRNAALDAKNFFAGPGIDAPYILHQFGGAVGGPIIKDKTFFFIDYEGSRQKTGSPGVVTTENPNFRKYVIQNSPDTLAAQFFNDFPGPNCTGSNPVFDPLAEFPIYTCRAVGSITEHNSADQYLIRVDEHLTPHDQLFVRWVNTLANGQVPAQELFGAGLRGFGAPFDGFFAGLGVGWTHEFGSGFINDLRFSYTRNDSNIGFSMPSSTKTAQILKAAGLPQSDFAFLAFDDGTIPMGGELYVPRNFVFNDFGVNEIVNKVVGRHSLKFGFEFRRIQENSNYRLESAPYYEFSSIAAFAFDAPYLVAATVNRDTSSPQFGQFADTPRHFRWNQWGAFAQDDWKVTPRLTLNLGLRWDVFQSPTETNNILTNITLGSGQGIFNQLANPATTVGRVSSLWNTPYHNFAPRIGFAYDPLGKGTTAIRGGFSIAYNEPYSNLYTNASRLNPPDAATMFVQPSILIGNTINYTFPFQPTPDFAGPVLPNGSVGPISDTAFAPTITPDGVARNLRAAYAMQWFLGLQHQFLHDFGVSLNYVGTHGVGGYTREDFNRFDGDICNVTFCNFFATRYTPGWGGLTFISNESQSIYHGFNAQLKKNFTHNYTFTANYTFGKVLDNLTEGGLGDYFNVNGYGLLYSGVSDVHNQRNDRAPSEFDVRHRFTLSALVGLPGPKEGVLHTVFGDWQLSSIITLQSGRPFDVYCGLGWFLGCDFNMDGLSYDRPNNPGNIKTSGFSNTQLADGIFGNPSLTFYGPTFESRTSTASQAFCPNGLNSIIDFGPVLSGPGSQCVTVGTNGTLGRNVFRGPAFKDFDFSLLKTFPIHERLSLQFHADAFNLFNRVNLYNPVGDLGSPQFGQSVAAFNPRLLQLGLKFVF